MTEYIKRENVLAKIDEFVKQNIAHGFPVDVFDIEMMKKMVEKLPAADVAPVVHAHWYMRGGRACCSNCNVKSLWGSDWDGCKNHEREFVSAKSNYCPNCGAKMDEGKI